jgi:hypothetical protein
MSEDTLRNESTEKENEALIQEMLRDAKTAEVEGDLTKNPLIHRGDEELPAPMVVKEIKSAGYVWIYETRTGEQIPCIYYMVGQKMRERRPDGSFIWTTKDPGFRPKSGKVICMLHPDHPNRAHYDELGFRVCKKANLINEFQMKQHMLRKHPQEWKAIEDERKEQERQEDRALQRAILEGASRVSMKQEPPLSTPELKLESPSVLAQERGLSDNEYVCSQCNAIHRTTSKLGKRHLKYKQ